jgi:hypothetical protein
MDGNSADYYAVLNVSRSATQEEIKAAYRIRAKELHPDKNRSTDTTAKFQLLQEAFSVLGSPERRKLYDAGNVAAAVDPATQATEVEFEPVCCDGCGCVSAQPRFVQYDRVVSVLFASFRSRPAGIFCPNCASRRLFWSTLITGSVGPLGLWGMVWSIIALSRNLTGGVRSPGLNSFLLARQAGYFLQNGRRDMACALAGESLSYFTRSHPGASDHSLGESGAEYARLILAEGVEPRLRLRSLWAGWSPPARNAFLGLVVAVSFWVFVITVTGVGDSSPRNASGTLAGNRATTQSSSTSSINLTNQIESADGRVYRVSSSDYRRLKTTRDEIEAHRISLGYRWDQAERASGEIEARRSDLDTTSDEAVSSFNARVREWNDRREALQKQTKDLQVMIAAFNAELHLVGQPIR